MSLRSLLASALRPSAATGCIGIVAADGHGAAAAVTRTPGAMPRLTALHAVTEGAVLPALAAWQRRGGLRRIRANLLLDGGDYQILPMDVPDVAPDEVADAMRWRVKDMIDYPAEEASIGCVLVPAASDSARTRQALVVVSRHDAIARWMQQSREARLDLHSIDVPELALRNLALLAAGDGACALLHVGLIRSTLVMVWRGDLCSVRRFDLRAAQLLDADHDAFEALIERLGQDVQRSTDAFERQFHAAALGRLWVTDEQAGLAICEPLTRHVTLQVRPMKLREWITVDATVPLMDAALGIDFIPAIGAALREEALPS
jgi:MSHA biogenesis protein MshI